MLRLFQLKLLSNLKILYCLILLLVSFITIASAAKDTPVYGKDDAIFGGIEEKQGSKPFGRVLDAGTGRYSLRWLSTLTEKGMTSLTAITADDKMLQSITPLVEKLGIQDITSLVIGNWFGTSEPIVSTDQDNDEILFDTIVADYLIGAMDGFSPYKQDQMIPLLTKYLKPGGRLYIVGMEPIPDSAEGDADIICQVRRARDACLLLAGQRPYREYPLTWITRQVARTEGLQFLQTGEYPIRHSGNFIARQINNGRRWLKLIKPKELGNEMKNLLDDLEKKAKKATNDGKIELSFNYVVSAVKMEEVVIEI